MLYASWLFQNVVPPIMSFAMGSLGFLTKFDFGQYEKMIGKAWEEGVSVGLRLRFEGISSSSLHHPVPMCLMKDRNGHASIRARERRPPG